jgi:voltage-gated potassium channel Kch
VGIERFPTARGLPLARDLGIPVLIGDAASRRTLARAGLARAAALVAAGSEERDNIAVAISAAAGSPSLPVVIRAGADDAIDETRSLFHIGPVADVNGLTATFVTRSMLGTAPYAVVPDGDQIVCVDAAGTVREVMPGNPERCTCS